MTQAVAGRDILKLTNALQRIDIHPGGGRCSNSQAG